VKQKHRTAFSNSMLDAYKKMFTKMIILKMTILKRTSESYILHHLLCLTLMISLTYNSSVRVKLLIQRALHCLPRLLTCKMKISETVQVSRNHSRGLTSTEQSSQIHTLFA